VLHILN